MSEIWLNLWTWSLARCSRTQGTDNKSRALTATRGLRKIESGMNISAIFSLTDFGRFHLWAPPVVEVVLEVSVTDAELEFL